jgi:large subunit ribosomal protein L4
LSGTSTLLTIAEHDPLVWKSSRNIGNLRVRPAGELNAYDLLHQQQLLVTKAALDRLRSQASGGNGSAGN